MGTHLIFLYLKTDIPQHKIIKYTVSLNFISCTVFTTSRAHVLEEVLTIY